MCKSRQRIHTCDRLLAAGITRGFPRPKPPALVAWHGWLFSCALGWVAVLYRPLLDTLHFFDKATETPRLIFKEEAGKTTIVDAALYEYLRGQLEA